MDNDLIVSDVEVSAPDGMEKEFKAAVRDIVVRIADTDKALSEKLHAEWLDYSKDSVARNGLVLPDTKEEYGYSVYGHPDGENREMDIRFDYKSRNYEKIPGFFYGDKQFYSSDMYGRSLFHEQHFTFILDGKKFAEVLKEEYGLDVRVRDVEFACLSENRGYDIVSSEVRPSLVKVKENIKVKGEDKMKEVKEEKSYARFELMTSYYYHQDNEAVSKALYNVNFDAMDKEPAIVQDVFRTIAEGKDGTITEVREKDMYWDTRTIGIYCGEEEYLIKATRLADEDNRNEYSTFISVAAPQKELDVFTKKIKNVFEQNHVHGVNVITESKDVSKGYLKSKFDSDKHVLTTDEQKLTMPVKSLGFTKEQMALSATPAPEKSRIEDICYISPSMKHRVEKEDGRHVPSYAIYTKQKDNSLAGYKINILAYCDTLEEAKRSAGENGYTNIVVENVEKKYELAMDEATCVMFGKKHYRIRALRDIPAHGIPAGRVGGFVESEKNLSQEGDCWVAHDALVTGDACVTDNAVVSGRATVMEQAKIQKDAQVSGYVVVTGNAVVGEHALVTGNAVVMDEAKVLSTAYICGDAQVCGKSKIGNAMVKDRAVVMDSFVWGEAHISGDAVVVNNARLHNGIKLVGYDYAEGNMPVQEQSGAIKKLFHNTRTERKKKPFERNRTAGKEMKPNVRK